MNINPEEAQAALYDIQHVTTKTQGMLNIWSYYMLLWGLVWAFGFLATQLQPQLVIWILVAMLLVGMLGSMILGIIQGARLRPTPGSQAAFLGSRLGIFHGVLYCFAVLWLIVFHLSALQVGVLWITVTMFGSITAGIWYRNLLSIGSGVGVTIISLLGYYLLPHYFWLWAAVFAGLPLIGISIYYMRQR
ncbi:MAG TPA: hypothetical protein VHZ51_24575 [Ktedonobacteraceae bacterium]|jgi:hypothetical protein|nr:hypothetical protein [Ktedonobacteraceae bacterium]